jgi:hypothetical protein
MQELQSRPIRAIEIPGKKIFSFTGHTTNFKKNLLITLIGENRFVREAVFE